MTTVENQQSQMNIPRDVDIHLKDSQVKDKLGTGSYENVDVQNVARTITSNNRHGYRPTGFNDVSGFNKYELPASESLSGIKYNAWEPFDETKRLKGKIGNVSHFELRKPRCTDDILAPQVRPVIYKGFDIKLTENHGPFEKPKMSEPFEKIKPIDYRTINDENKRFTKGFAELPENDIKGTFRVIQRAPDIITRNEPRRGANKAGYGRGGFLQRSTQKNAGKPPAKYVGFSIQ